VTEFVGDDGCVVLNVEGVRLKKAPADQVAEFEWKLLMLMGCGLGLLGREGVVSVENTDVPQRAHVALSLLLLRPAMVVGVGKDEASWKRVPTGMGSMVS
jgi:hypothetical protein